jgi:hypothetical protein
MVTKQIQPTPSGSLPESERQGIYDRGNFLLHQQHLTGALDGVGQTALIMSRHTGVFAGQDAALIGDVLAEQIGVLIVQGVGGEINLRLWPGCAIFHWALAALIFVGMSFAGHKNYLISR